MSLFKSTLVASSLLSLVSARDIPANVKALHDSIVAQGHCNNVLAGGFYNSDSETAGNTTYCADHLADYGIVYLQGLNGTLSNLDTDCDGVQHGVGDDGRCGSSSDTQSQTTFKDTVASYGANITDLNAYVHPYVVFGNSGTKPGWKTWDPTSVGIQPLSIIAVVCGNQLIYGVWGDTNGDDGSKPVVGEGAISLGTACYGKENTTGNSGHDPDDVLFIAFTGSEAVPGANGAKWNATNYSDFEASISGLGDKLVSRFGTNYTSNSTVPGGNGNGNGNGNSSAPTSGADGSMWSSSNLGSVFTVVSLPTLFVGLFSL